MTTGAVLYLRISLDATGEALGVDRQEAECRVLADRLGYTVARVYTDNDISATSGKRRPAFERLLTEVAEGGTVITWHTDRLVRLTGDLERVLERGLTVHAVTAGHLDLSTPAGRAVARTLTAWATYEGEQKSLRQKARNRQDAEAGKAYVRVRPFGYTRNMEQVPAEAAAVRDAVTRLLAGQTLADVVRAWNDAGLQTTKGNRWVSTTVRQTLSREALAGIRKLADGREIVGDWQAIITEDEHRALLALFADPKRRQRGTKRPVSLIAGLARCACGGPIHSANVNRNNTPRYRCDPTGHFSTLAAPVDAQVVGLTGLLLSHPDARDHLAAPKGQDTARAALLAERRALETRRDVEMPQALAAGLSIAQVAAANRQITERLADVEAELAASASEDMTAVAVAISQNALSAMPEWALTEWQEWVWDALALEAQRAVVRSLWLVTLHRGRVQIEATELATGLLERTGLTPLMAEWE